MILSQSRRPSLPRLGAADEFGTMIQLSADPCIHCCRAILTLLLTTGFVWHTQAAELVPVEERLKENLENRVLIFREKGIEGRHIRFDTSGRPLHRSNKQDNASRRAFLFMDLELHDDRMVIVGEEIQIQLEAGERNYVRDSRRLNLVTCTVDLSGEEPTFPWLIGILARIFLQQTELQGE